MDRKRLINRNIDYIMKHLDEDLSPDTVAAHFSISKCHFSRIFREETGESAYVFTKRCRVDQDTIDMKLNPAKVITDIGLDYRYSASNYSSVFRQHHDTPPSMFRQPIPTHNVFPPFSSKRTVHFRMAEKYTVQIEAQKQENLPMLYEHFTGTYADLEKNWYQLLNRYKGSLSGKALLVERFLNSPAITSPLQCICDICVTVKPGYGLSNIMRVSGDQQIIHHFDGKIEDIFEALEGTSSIWFSQSDYKMTRRCGFNTYHRVNWGNHSIIMDLYILVS